MKRTVTILLLAVASAFLLGAQFGGILNRAKDKIDQGKQKAKPVSDRAERAAENFSAWTPEEEQQIGEATAAKMIAMFGILDAPKLTSYVSLVGGSVAQFAPRQVPYRFGILDSDIVGAFSLPGGFIFITKSALEGMANEAQLAGALGHEIVHVSERHLESEIRSKKNSAWAVEEAKAKTSSQTPEYLSNKADAFLKEMFNMRLSRDKEDGADERGTMMAAQAGYAASGLLDFLRTLSAVNAQPGNQRAFGQLLSTHPPFDERIARLTPIVAKSAAGGKTLEARFRGTVK
jgi:beta-barrel assembly-enhancing protease